MAGLVPPEQLPAATGAISAALNVTRLVGPAVGGALVAAVGFRVTTVVVAAALAGAAGLLGALPRAAGTARSGVDRHDLPGGAVQRRAGAWARGWLVVSTGRDRRAVVVLQLADAVKEGTLSALFPVLLLGVIGAGPAFTGVVNSSFAVTAVVAGPVVGLVTRRFGYPGPMITGAVVAAGLLSGWSGGRPGPSRSASSRCPGSPSRSPGWPREPCCCSTPARAVGTGRRRDEHPARGGGDPQRAGRRRGVARARTADCPARRGPRPAHPARRAGHRPSPTRQVPSR